jgi:hypothetical protein
MSYPIHTEKFNQALGDFIAVKGDQLQHQLRRHIRAPRLGVLLFDRQSGNN